MPLICFAQNQIWISTRANILATPSHERNLLSGASLKQIKQHPKEKHTWEVYVGCESQYQ